MKLMPAVALILFNKSALGQRSHGKKISVAFDRFTVNETSSNNNRGFQSAFEKIPLTYVYVAVFFGYVIIYVIFLFLYEREKKTLEDSESPAPTRLTRLLKSFLRLIYGKSEIERIVASDGDSLSLVTVKLSRSLMNSKQLLEIGDIVSHGSFFSPSDLRDRIVRLKKIKGSQQDRVQTTLLRSLHAVHYIHTVLLRIEKMQATHFSNQNRLHLELLDEYWDDMMPDAQRKTASQWKEVGFHGDDPAMELEGTGILGLLQLTYFARMHPSEARGALRESRNPDDEYPFTFAGITVTSFIMELARGRHIHYKLLELLEAEIAARPEIMTFDEKLSQRQQGPSTYGDLVEKGCNVVHDLYCEVIMKFCALWGEQKRSKGTSFQTVMEDVKDEMKQKYKRHI